MRAIGVVRKVDDLGRISIPVKVRRDMGLKENAQVEIYVDGERIVLEKYGPACVFCGNKDGVRNFRGKNVCRECVDTVKSIFINSSR